MLGEERQSKDNLLAENKMLKKQNEELILHFKKQHKLTDTHKRQKVEAVTLLLHIPDDSLDQNTDTSFFFSCQIYFEADSLPSFTKEEFAKALDWGNTQL